MGQERPPPREGEGWGSGWSGLAGALTGPASIRAGLAVGTLGGLAPSRWCWRLIIGARKKSRNLWKKSRGYVSAAVDPLAVSPVRHQFPPQLERALLAVLLLEREQVCPIGRLNGAALDRPAEIAQLAFLKSDLFPLKLAGVALER